MIYTIKDITEAKSYSVRAGKHNREVTVKRNGVCNFIDGEIVYVSSIDVKTVVDQVMVTVIGKGAWVQIKEGYKVVGWEFKPSGGTCAPIKLHLVEG